MKIYILLILLIFPATAIDLYGQKKRTDDYFVGDTPKKDVSAAANRADPQLTTQGRERAERLFETIKKYKPEQIFSTNFIRTRATAAPLAIKLNPKYRIETQAYDFNELEEFAARLLKLKIRCAVVVGHNTTTPELANLLIKQDKYEGLPESEYGKIWIIKIKNGKAIDMLIEY